MKNIKILVATHKKFTMPTDDMYLPIHVGREGKVDLGYLGDNVGENISHKNQNYCELTGLYWAWKNIECDYIGLAHYRRYFTSKGLITRLLNKNNKFDLICSKESIEDLLEDFDIILPKKRNYYIESVWTHYSNSHHIKDMEETKKIIEEKYPNYVSSFEKVMNGSKIHLFNMFVMKKELFDNYCEWLFDILFELENRVDISGYSPYQSRIFGFISERLFNVWLEKQNKRICTLSVINLQEVDWLEKITSFLRRKVRGYNEL